MFKKVYMYSLYSAFCTQPAFNPQSTVCILHSVCILPLVRGLQSAVRSLRLTLTDSPDRPQLNCSVTAATSQRLKVGNCAAKPLPRASRSLQRLHSAFASRCNFNEAAVWLQKCC